MAFINRFPKFVHAHEIEAGAVFVSISTDWNLTCLKLAGDAGLALILSSHPMRADRDAYRPFLVLSIQQLTQRFVLLEGDLVFEASDDPRLIRQADWSPGHVAFRGGDPVVACFGEVGLGTLTNLSTGARIEPWPDAYWVSGWRLLLRHLDAAGDPALLTLVDHRAAEKVF